MRLNEGKQNQLNFREMKQTAVEFLMDKLFDQSTMVTEQMQWFEQAKQMEKEQMVDFARNIIIDATCSVEGYVTTDKDIVDYYNETFNTNEK